VSARRTLALDLLTLAAFCGFLFFYGLGAFGLTGADEPRYAQVAREMLARGDWVVPVLNGTPWLEKPPLYYWEAILAYKMFGVSDWAARLPGAFSASTLVFAIYFFARGGGQVAGAAAVDAALITASSAAMIGFARGASTDMPLAANFAIAMLAWFAWYSGGQRRWLAVFYFFLALGALAKGPVAPGLAGITIVLFVALRREPRTLVRTLWWPGLLLFCAVALPWYFAVEARVPEFFRVFLLQHNLERFCSDLFRHRQPFWYYLPVTLAALVPWMIYGVCGLIKAARTWPRAAEHHDEAGDNVDNLTRDKLARFLLIWAVVPVIFFSFSQSKLPGYILPAVPAWTLLAWLATRSGLQPRSDGNSNRDDRPNLALLLPHAAISAALVFAAIVLPYRLVHAPVPQAALIFAGMVAAAALVGVTWTVWAQGMQALRFVTLAPLLVALALVLRVAAPAIDATQSARPLFNQIASMEMHPQQLAVLHAPRQIEYGLDFYRNQDVASHVASYDRAEIPRGDHIVVARAGSGDDLRALLAPRRVLRLGEFAPQRLEYFWVEALK